MMIRLPTRGLLTLGLLAVLAHAAAQAALGPGIDPPGAVEAQGAISRMVHGHPGR